MKNYSLLDVAELHGIYLTGLCQRFLIPGEEFSVGVQAHYYVKSVSQLNWRQLLPEETGKGRHREADLSYFVVTLSLSDQLPHHSDPNTISCIVEHDEIRYTQRTGKVRHRTVPDEGYEERMLKAFETERRRVTSLRNNTQQLIETTKENIMNPEDNSSASRTRRIQAEGPTLPSWPPKPQPTTPKDCWLAKQMGARTEFSANREGSEILVSVTKGGLLIEVSALSEGDDYARHSITLTEEEALDLLMMLQGEENAK